MNFSQRSMEQELLDDPLIPFEDIKKNMEELDFINRWLGGHNITKLGLKGFIQNDKHPLHICEIGCGGGDNLRALKRWCERRNIPAMFTGIDINPHCIAFARSRNENAGIAFICADYKEVRFESKPAVIFSSLFCHHFDDQGLQQILQWCKQHAQQGFFINDLHRHPVAFYSIKWLTRLFSKSYMVKQDAPLSVRRGFSRHEWVSHFQQAGISHYSIRWKWAFRWLITCKQNGQ